jgi:hypothetical protein
METQVQAAGGEVLLSSPANAATGSEVTVYNASPLTFGANTTVVDLRTDTVTLTDGSSLNLTANPSSAIRELITELNAAAKADTTLAVWLSCDSSTVLRAQMAALEAAGVKDIVFDAGNGDYTGISVSN